MSRGGKRTGAGRKPAEDPKKIVAVGIRQSKIEQAGGLEAVKQKIRQMFD